MKILKTKKDYSLRRRHRHTLKPVTVDGTTYNVLNAFPVHTEEKTKTAKELLTYLIKGKEK